MRRVAILGSTGSIGRQTLDVARNHPDRIQIVGLTANHSAVTLASQAAEFGVKNIALMDAKVADEAGIAGGMEAVVNVATADDVDVVVVSVAGVIGLIPTLAAIRANKNIALASKEVLVAAGEIVMPLIRSRGISMWPIDSEHSALAQCLRSGRAEEVDRLILTASGGPFRGKTAEDLANVTSKEALNHPTWKMGGKITIDSATLMNKALEIIEAHWLFDMPMDRIDVVVHPQSIVHSMVRFTDGSVVAQMGWPDMRIPIQYALMGGDRPGNSFRPWNPLETPNLNFEPVNERVFPALQLARQAVRQGGTSACAFNAANEAAVAAFLEGRVGFLAITSVVGEVLARHVPQDATLDNLLETDAWARTEVESRIGTR